MVGIPPKKKKRAKIEGKDRVSRLTYVICKVAWERELKEGG
jgi:hypothetical protein